MSTGIQRIGSGWSIAPANMQELYRFAELMADSDLVPKDYKGKPGNVMVAIQMGGELGLSPMQSVQNIAVVNGRPTLWGDGLLAVCQAHPSFVDIAETDDGNTATCVVKRQGRTDVVVTFSMEDAKRAGLAGKQGPWSQYPARMRQMRARGFALRNAFADALRGMISFEEARDIPGSDATQVRAEVIDAKGVAEQMHAGRQKLAAKNEQQEERKSTPPPAADEQYEPGFADSYPDPKLAGAPLRVATGEQLSDYAAWLESLIADKAYKKVHAKARKSLDEVTAAMDALLEAEASKAPADPVATKLQGVIDERESQPGGLYDQKEEGWGLASP